MSWSSSASPIADGFMIYLNLYDNQIYCLGKGPSATTVQTPLTAVKQGDSIVIQGTVTDESAGAKQLVQTGEFNIVPAMSDKDQGVWMEYLYMQKPKPANATGVQVRLQALDSNGNTEEIGTVTSDSNGMFMKLWQPSTLGEYKVIATFEGSESYWTSQAESAVGVVAASATPTQTATPTESPTAVPTTASPTTTPSAAVNPKGGPDTLVYVAIAAVIAIIVIAVVALVLRRRK